MNRAALQTLSDGIVLHKIAAHLPEDEGATQFICSCGFNFNEVTNGEPSMALYELHVEAERAKRVAELTERFRVRDDQEVTEVVGRLVALLATAITDEPCETSEAGRPGQSPEDAALEHERNRHLERVHVYKGAWTSLTILDPWLDENEWNIDLREAVKDTLARLERAIGREVISADHVVGL